MNIVSGQGMPDFVMLDNVTEESFIHNLELRFRKKQIYTYIGEQVVAMNPFERLKIYSQEDMKNYLRMELYEVQPHLFALGDDTFRNLMRTKQDQCVLITGESGAGKTEASKYFMQYIVHVSGSKGGGDNIKDRLLESNPVLEAFGNAKTVRNDNSSRFGKYMEIQFSGAGAPLGGKISQYLLEKSRVVTRAMDERSFHIFYQLLSEQSLLGPLGLSPDATRYEFLKSSKCVNVRGMDDNREFQDVLSAMQQLSFPEQDQKSVWRILSAILHLGNINFQQNAKDESEVKNPAELKPVSDMLGIAINELSKALTTNEIKTGAQVIAKKLNQDQAYFARDSFAKALYDKLFDWVVDRINSSIQCTGSEIVIGVLDIYGFEIFEINSFEQFCINYCNEKLQQLFIRLVLEAEQKEYHAEGIEWTDIDYFNNAPIVDLFESKQGLYKTLDEACLIGQPTPMSLLDKLNTKFKDHDHYQQWEAKSRDIPRGAFRIKHYAGTVDYNVDEFVFKNTDTLFRTIKNAIKSSSDSLTNAMFPDVPESKKRPVSSGWQFKINVNELIGKLNSCQPHYIRCIKSNDKKQAFGFDNERVRHQVAYLNLVETVRVRRAGFCNRQPYTKFLHRYKMCSDATWPNWHSDDKSGTSNILTAMGIKEDEYLLGKTKLFVRNASTLSQLERLRDQNMPKVALVIQNTWRRLRVKSKALRYINQIKSQYTRGQHPNYGIDSPVPEPKQLSECSGSVAKLLNDWWLVCRVLAMSPATQANLRMKLWTYNALGGKKKYDINGEFQGDVLTQACKNDPKLAIKHEKCMANIRNTGDRSEVLFSSYCKRVNQRCKPQLRGVIITGKTLYRTDAKSFRVKKAQFPLTNIVSIHVSPNKDTYIVIKFEPPYHDYVMDVGLEGVDRISELVTVLQKWVTKLKGSRVPVVVEEPIEFNVARTAKKVGLQLMMHFAVDPKATTCNTLKKGGNKVTIGYRG